MDSLDDLRDGGAERIWKPTEALTLPSMRFAIWRARRVCGMSTPTGFSQYTCLPPALRISMCSTWKNGGVEICTASMCGLAAIALYASQP
jgi:hypothetical protein